MFINASVTNVYYVFAFKTEITFLILYVKTANIVFSFAFAFENTVLSVRGVLSRKCWNTEDERRTASTITVHRQHFQTIIAKLLRTLTGVFSIVYKFKKTFSSRRFVMALLRDYHVINVNAITNLSALKSETINMLSHSLMSS